MALVVYSVVLVNLHALAEGDHFDVPTPDGFKMVVRDIAAASGASGTIPQLRLTDLTTGANFYIGYVSGLILESLRQDMRQVFDPGGGFKVEAITNSWDVRISGYQLAV